MKLTDPVWRRYVMSTARKGPVELGYSFFRGLRRRKNAADDDGLSESDALALTRLLDYTEEDIRANAAIVGPQATRGGTEIRTIQWFLPFFAHAYLGGIYTILRFAERFQTEHGVENRFCIFDALPQDIDTVAQRMAEAFPSLAGCEVTGSRAPKPPGVGEMEEGPPAFSHLRECDAAVATLWTSAYTLLHFNRTKSKFYFVQDYEPQFYAAGSASALAEETYRFGFEGIVNTPGLAEAYREHGSPAVSFVPAVDTHRYHPPAQPRPEEPVRIFFYGRPFTHRNAFGVGVAALLQVRERFGDRIEIVCAGENWNPGQYGIADYVTNLGRLGSMEEVAELYRSCHIGLVLMLTKHPSYQPFEFLASGMACVSNDNPATSWFLRDGENALTAPPVPGPLADRIARLVEDRELRESLAECGRQDVTAVRWDEQIDAVWASITGTGG